MPITPIFVHFILFLLEEQGIITRENVINNKEKTFVVKLNESKGNGSRQSRGRSRRLVHKAHDSNSLACFWRNLKKD
jgi:hypothetical protein